MVWVKFHEEITRGAKRGIPRALRFVLLELSLHARPLRGRIELPMGMSDADAVADLLGGSRAEVDSALAVFADGDDPVLFFKTLGKRRFLVIPSWEKWNAGATEPPGASTERWRKARDSKRATNGEPTTVGEDSQRATNGQPTPPRVEESRSEEIRSDPERDPSSAVTEPSGSGLPPSSEISPPEQASPPDAAQTRPLPSPPSGPGSQPLTAPLPHPAPPQDQQRLLTLEPPTKPTASAAEAIFAAYVVGWRRVIHGTRAPVLDAKRRKLVAARLREFDADHLESAARGIWESSWNVENRQTDFDLIMRDAAHVERFAALDPAQKPKRRPGAEYDHDDCLDAPPMRASVRAMSIDTSKTFAELVASACRGASDGKRFSEAN